MPADSHSRRRLSWQQRTRHHVVLALLSVTLTMGIFYALEAKSVLFRLSMATAYAGLAFLSASLVIGPWNVLRHRSNPVSTNLRRDIGIWAGLLGLAHVVVGLQVHMQGKFWRYFFYPPDRAHFLPLRYDPFGVANFTGLGSTLVLILLLGLSNDWSLRALGIRRWKTLQRWNYAGFALVVVHGVLYQLVEKRKLLFVALFSAMGLLVVALQCLGCREIRTRAHRAHATSC